MHIILLLINILPFILCNILDSLNLLGGGGRVVGGHEVKPSFKYKFMVSIQYKLQQSCGGSLIKYNKILTAAHCTFDDIKDFTVHINRHNLSNSEEAKLGYQFNVTSRINHPLFKDAAEGYDVSIWTIDSPSTFSINSYPLLDPGTIGNKENLKLSAIGWGKTSTKGKASNLLMEVTLPIVNMDKCKSNYRTQNLILNQSQLCAGFFEDAGMDTCQGDSGGPLFIKVDDVYYIVGIVSYGIGCASPDLPGIYSRVSYLLDFINQNI